MKNKLTELLHKIHIHNYINLRGKTMGNEGVNALAQMLENNTTITSIDFSYNRIGDKGASSLAQMLENNTTITSIYLRYNNIRAQGANALAQMLEKNKTLTFVNLRDNNIGDEGAKALAQMLEKNKTLTFMNLRDNNIGNEGTEALAQMLEKNQTITSVNLSYNNIRSEGAKALAQMLETNKTITSIDLSYNINAQTSQIKTFLKRNIELKELNKKQDKIIKKICRLDSDILLKSKFEDDLKKTLQVKLAKALPELLLKLTDTELFEFNKKAGLVKDSCSYSNLKECLIKITCNAELINAIFNDYATKVAHVFELNKIISSLSSMGFGPLYNLYHDITETKNKEKIDFDTEIQIVSDLLKILQNQPLTKIAAYLGNLLENNPNLPNELINYLIRAKNIVKHHIDIELDTGLENNEETEILSNNNNDISYQNLILVSKDVQEKEDVEVFELTKNEKEFIITSQQESSFDMYKRLKDPKTNDNDNDFNGELFDNNEHGERESFILGHDSSNTS